MASIAIRKARSITARGMPDETLWPLDDLQRPFPFPMNISVDYTSSADVRANLKTLRERFRNNYDWIVGTAVACYLSRDVIQGVVLKNPLQCRKAAKAAVYYQSSENKGRMDFPDGSISIWGEYEIDDGLMLPWGLFLTHEDALISDAN